MRWHARRDLLVFGSAYRSSIWTLIDCIKEWALKRLEKERSLRLEKRCRGIGLCTRICEKARKADKRRDRKDWWRIAERKERCSTDEP